MTETRKPTRVIRRPTTTARPVRTRGSAMLLAVALAAACDREPVAAPPAAIAPASESTALLSAASTSDREILTRLYEATDGSNWVNDDNWSTAAPLGEWHGVTVNADGRVTELSLVRNRLSGAIPTELGGLAELRLLSLWGNSLTGAIPPELGALGNLMELDLDFNQLTSVPPELGGLVSLESLSLRSNRLTAVPPEIGGLVALESLSLRSNQITAVPPELGGLVALEYLNLMANQLTAVPPELGGLVALEYLNLRANRLTSVPPELGGLVALEYLELNFNRLTSVPPQLRGLTNLEYLGLWSNELTSIPSELGELGNLRALDLDENRLTNFPVGPGDYPNLRALWLSSNEFSSIPPALAELVNLVQLVLEGNRLTSMPPGLGGMASLWRLDLSSNEFISFPRALGELGNLRHLELDGNRMTDVPRGLALAASAERLAPSADESRSVLRRRTAAPSMSWETRSPGSTDPDGDPRASVARKLSMSGALAGAYRRDGSRSTAARPRGRGLAGLEVLDLSSNGFSGPLPTGLLEFTGLTSLGLADNPGLTGALPLGLTALEHLEDLHTVGTELCAPAVPTFLDWLGGVTRQRVTRCGHDGDATAYLTQVVQSRDFPVPLVAGEPALLRVFVTAERTTGVGLPPVRATFYRDGAVWYRLEIPAKSDPIPTAVDESSLSKSVNAEIPGWVIRPGLEMVIEPDPHGTLDPALGVATRIPATGRMAVDVRTMPVFELTLVPFIWKENPDRSIVDITAGMAADPEGHNLFERTHMLLPIAELDVAAHPVVTSPTNNGFAILRLTEMIRVVEGGRGHYLGVMAGPTGPGSLKGVANGIGSWSSFSILDAHTIAHELGHNRNLYHAPCGGAGGPDRYYPYGDGNIGAWGYDLRSAQLVPPSQSDFMSYCDPAWVSDYQFTNAVRYRLETESNSILVTAADGDASSSRTLLIWGGLDGDGAPYLRPAFFIDAPPTLPAADGSWSLTGRGPGGAELFSVSFAMAEFTDTEDDRAGFTFALPVTWAGELASIALQGPGGSVSLDRDTDDPLTILRDAATGRIRGILDGPPPAAPSPPPGTPAAAADPGFEVLFSRGIPSTGN